MIRASGLALAALAACLATPASAAVASSSSSSSFQLFSFGGLSGPVIPTAVSNQNVPAIVSGRLVVRFQGSASAGCAAVGVCGYSGTVQWTPPARASLDISAFTIGRRRLESVSLFPQFGPFAGESGGVTTAAVALAGAPAEASACADAVSNFNAFDLPAAHGLVALRLGHSSPGLLGTRCAGPRDSDIDPHLPVAHLPLTALRAGRRTISLTRSASFATPGFAVAIQSTLAVRLGRPGRIQAQATNRRSRRYRVLTIGYHARLRGSVTERFAGAGLSAECGPLGACGLTGTATVRPSSAIGAAAVTAFAPASRPERDLLAAVGLSRTGDPTGVSVTGSAQWRNGGTVATAVAQGTLVCHDSASAGGASVLMIVSRRRLGAAYLATRFGEGAVSRCPGPIPQTGTSVGTIAGLATTSVLGARTASITLNRAGARSSDYGYALTFVPQLRLTLTRTAMTTRIITGPATGL
jgi:hypothetical protein